VAVIDHRQLHRLLGRSLGIAERHVDPICVGLQRIIDELGDRIAVAAIAEITDAADEGFRHHQPELRSAGMIGIGALGFEYRLEARAVHGGSARHG
jgi:hypothetical protein